MAEELVRGIKSTSKSGSPHNDSNATLVKRWFGGIAAAAALILRSRFLMSNPLVRASAFLVTDPTTGNPRLQLGARTHNLSSNLLSGDLSIDTGLQEALTWCN